MWGYWLWVWRSGRGRRGRSQPSWTGGWASGAAHWSASHSRHEPRPNTEPTAPLLDAAACLSACWTDFLTRPQPTSADRSRHQLIRLPSIITPHLNNTNQCLFLKRFVWLRRNFDFGELMSARTAGKFVECDCGWAGRGRCCLQFTLLLEPCFAYCE